MGSSRLDHLRIKQLKFVGLLASLGSLAATAEHLSMTASAASMMLKEIEGIFNVKLFRRQGRGMTLTEQGRALLPRCQTVLGEVGAMRASLQGAEAPLLRIGAFPHTTTTVLPKIVRNLISGAPAWRLQLFEQSAEDLLARLLAGEIDLMLGRLPRRAANSNFAADLAQRVLYEGSLAVVCRRKHPLVRQRPLPLAALLDWPWVLPPEQSTTRVAVMDAFLRQGLTPPVPVVEAPSYFYGLSLLADSDLLTCCASSPGLESDKNFSILPVEVSLNATPVAMIWRKSSAEAQRAVDQLDRLAASSADWRVGGLDKAEPVSSTQFAPTA